MKRPAKKAKGKKMRAFFMWAAVTVEGKCVFRPCWEKYQAMEDKYRDGRLARVRVTEVRTPTRKAKA